MTDRDGILVLGGGGFIGTALVRKLTQLGKQVHIISRKPLAIREAKVIVHIGDLSDAALLKKIQYACDTVVHLAAATTPGSSAIQPSQEIETLAATLQLLEAMQDWPDTHLIFVSSGGTIYGNPLRNPVNENAPLAPLSYHGAGKLAIEGFVNAYRAADKHATILRPSNTYGPEQELRQGFGLIRTVLQHLAMGTSLTIWGDGENVRDFLYIDDMVDALILAVDARKDNGAYNVGSGCGHTLNRVVAIAQQSCNRRLDVKYLPARGNDVREVVLDISRIGSCLGWAPSITLEEGILRTWDWICKS